MIRLRKKPTKQNYRVTYTTDKAQVRAVTTNAYSAKFAAEIVRRDFNDCAQVLTVSPEWKFS